jgi:hypothetical protein
LVDDAIGALARAVGARRSSAAAQAAIDVGRWSTDLELRHRPVTEIDLARYGLWADQLVLDAAADELDLVRGDDFAMDYVRDRVRASLAVGDAAVIDALMEELNTAIGDEDLESAATAAQRLRTTLVGSTS